MTYRLVSISEYEARGMLPAHICKKISDEKAYIFCGEEDEMIVSIAVFSESHIHSGEVILEHIQVPESLRRMGYAHELMEYCYDAFAKAGVNRIYCKCCNTPESLKEIYRFLLSEKFIPLTFDGHLMEYYVQDLLDSNTIKRIAEQYEQIPRVMTTTDPNHPYLKAFMVRCGEIRHSLNWNIFDMEWSRFYVQDEKIVGAFLGKKIDEHTLFIPITYIDMTSSDMKAYISLLISCIQQVQQKMPEDAKIKLQTFDDETYNTMQKMCGVGETDYLLQEYVRILCINNK